MEPVALLSSVLHTMERYRMVPAGAAVLCGFSGGADSVTLLSVLQELSKGYGDVPPFLLAACHVNHGIRGEEAERDEAFCRSFCEERDIPLYIKHADVPAIAQEENISEETAGRRVRYAFFAETAERLLNEHPDRTSVRIATAHTASDNAETVLFHLARGTGLSGLAGIPPVRDDIIRPLLECDREEIEAYCASEGLSFVKDSTNKDIAYARNRIRYEVLPVLKDLNSGAVTNMARTTETLRRDVDYFAAQTEALLDAACRGTDTYDVRVLSAAEDAVLVRALSKALTEFAGVQAEQRHIETVLDWIRRAEKFKQIQIPGGAYVTLTGEQLRLRWPPVPEEVSELRFSVAAFDTGQIVFETDAEPQIAVRLTKLDLDQADFRPLVLENCLDYDKIESNFMLRGRQPGDTFSPVGRGVHKKLKSLYQEAGVPADTRNDRVLLEREGEIAWLEGFGVADGYQVTRETKTIWYVEVKR